MDLSQRDLRDTTTLKEFVHVALVESGLFNLFMLASLKTTSILLAGWEFAYVENQRKCSKLEPYAYWAYSFAIVVHCV